jgi:hypothetical protein
MRFIFILLTTFCFICYGSAAEVSVSTDKLSENFKAQVMAYLRDSGKLAVLDLEQSFDLDLGDFRQSINSSRASSELLQEIWPKDFDSSLKKRIERIEKMNKMALLLWEKNADIVAKALVSALYIPS